MLLEAKDSRYPFIACIYNVNYVLLNNWYPDYLVDSHILQE